MCEPVPIGVVREPKAQTEHMALREEREGRGSMCVCIGLLREGEGIGGGGGVCGVTLLWLTPV
jgi:hypothetical protein